MPGTALEVGCGEGADAIWLTGQGWQVTGTDFSAQALHRAAEHTPNSLAGRLTWQQADIRDWNPRARPVTTWSPRPSTTSPNPCGALSSPPSPTGSTPQGIW
ncbi:class I SAM-dependent methyltransferase [Streptomyces sp900116325]|uniref:class I SAM-dependent methyltransferase n=1 Tax=Streptomyces sp. 900116325 TaxID=3154295 RepID=UPI0033BEE305